MKIKLTNNKVFVLLVIAAIAILGWGVYTATARRGDKEPDIAAPAAGGSSSQTAGGSSGTTVSKGVADGEVQKVGVGDSVDFVVRDAQGNIKK